MKKLILFLCFFLIYSFAFSATARKPGEAAYTRDINKIDFTSTGIITEADILANKAISNQGASGTIVLTLPALSYYFSFPFLVEEAQILSPAPPSGEAFDLDGTTLAADDEVDSDNVVGSKMVVTRMQDAAGAWFYSLDTARGTWIDGN